MGRHVRRWMTVVGAVALIGCASEVAPEAQTAAGGKADDTHDAAGVAVLGSGAHDADAVQIEVVADHRDGLDSPRDVEINPTRPDELWIVNQSDDSMVIVRGLGTYDREATKYDGPANEHFLAQPSALAFGKTGVLATAQETDERTQLSTPADFMGPTLWSADRMIFDGGHGGHIDMLHNSPNGAGIAWWTDNAYFIFDGYHESITYYDFNDDHGPGGSDHSDGVVLRFVEGEVSYVPGVPSHMVVDRASSLLYVADTGNARIASLSPTGGEFGADLYPNYDGTMQKMVEGPELRTVVEGAEVGLERPSGLALHGGLLYVGDNATSTIYAFDLEGELQDHLSLATVVEHGGLMGLTFDDDGQLYAVDAADARILRISAAE